MSFLVENFFVLFQNWNIFVVLGGVLVSNFLKVCFCLIYYCIDFFSLQIKIIISVIVSLAAF